MAALTADLGLEISGEIEETEFHPVKGSVLIYEGAMVAVDATGFIVPAANVAGLRVIGVALHQVATTGLADGVRSLQVGTGKIVRAHAGITQAMTGKRVYVADDQTVTATVGNAVIAGIFRKFEPSGKALIEMGAYVTTVSA
jgi:hypothetical protein